MRPDESVKNFHVTVDLYSMFQTNVFLSFFLCPPLPAQNKVCNVSATCSYFINNEVLLL